MRSSVATRTRWKRWAHALTLALLVAAPQVPASAQATAAGVSITLEVQPTSPFFQEEIHAVLILEGTGDPLDGVTVEAFGDCDDLFVGPDEVLGDGDATLEIGEQWSYTCDTRVFHGLINIEVSGMSGGETVMATGGIEYGAPFPIDGVIVPPIASAEVGEEVTWSITVGNLASYSLIGVAAEIRILYDNQTFPVPFEPMIGPVETNGNGDDILDPGETWEYSYSAPIVSDSRAQVNVIAAPDFAPLTSFGSTFESAVVTLAATTPTTTTPGESELPLTGAHSDDYLLSFAILVLLTGIGIVAAARTSE